MILTGMSLLLVAGAGAASSRAARAQQQEPAPPGNAQRAGMRPVADVLSRIGQAVGVTIVADNTVANERVPLPAAPTTPENFETQVAEVAKALPQGATWAKLYLPATSRTQSGEDVAAYAMAQAKLFGSVGAAQAGTVEILGQRVPAEKAQEYITGLNLKPVYLVTNPRLRATASQPAAGVADNNLQQWMQMTPEQRQQYAQAQASQLLNMDPTLRQQMMEQQRMIMRQMMRQMTPEQRQQMFQGRGGGQGRFGGPRGGNRGQQ
jgi:hypothetical protein